MGRAVTYEQETHQQTVLSGEVAEEAAAAAAPDVGERRDYWPESSVVSTLIFFRAPCQNC